MVRPWAHNLLCAGLLCFRFPRTLQLFLLGVVLGLS